MKRASAITIVVSIAIALLLAGCAGKESAGQYKNGTYKATYNAFDGHGWKPQMDVTVAGGKVSTVTFDYVNKQGQLKTQDQNYAAQMKKVSGTTPAESAATLQKELVAKQASGVDAVTGATEASAEFNALSDAILAKAKSGDTSATVLTMNSTYTAAVPSFDSHGWKGQIAVTFTDNKITAVTYDEVNKDKVLKTKDAAYAKNMSAKTNITPAEAYSKLEKELISTQDPTKVDAVTGATEGSHTFVELATQAIAAR
ncbi:MAG TPA: FMN-binding protein [Spirochaetia bacterium]|nr:FMN-binding protein [Spirochaetia bacterium]